MTKLTDLIKITEDVRIYQSYKNESSGKAVGGNAFLNSFELYPTEQLKSSMISLQTCILNLLVQALGDLQHCF